MFQCKQIHKMTWTSPDGRTRHHRKKVEEKLGGRQSQTRSSLGTSPGGGRPEGQAESLQRLSRQAIPQI